MQNNKTIHVSLRFYFSAAIGIFGAMYYRNRTILAKIPMILELTLLFLLVVTTNIYADIHYVRAGATGTESGNDWTNAYIMLPATLVRGDTYYLSGGIYADYSFDDVESGTQYIFIKKATIGSHGTNTGWNDLYASSVAQIGSIKFFTGYYDIDGVTGGGPGGWTSGFGIKVYGGGVGGKVVNILGSFVNGLRFRHIEFEHDQGRDSHNSSEHIFYGPIYSGSNHAANDVVVQYCYLHDVSGCMFITNVWSNVTLEYSKVARNGYSVVGIDSIHREAWSAIGDDNVIIRYNIFEDISNTAVIAIVNNGGGNVSDRWELYGNVFVKNTLDNSHVSSLMVLGYDNTMTISNWKFYNNSIINMSGSTMNSGAGVQVNCVAFNNLYYNNTGNAVGPQYFTHDYSFFSGNIRTEGCTTSCDLDPDAAASEVHGQDSSGDPFVDWVNGDYRLKTSTNAGMSLPSPYNTDMNGNTRGADGLWDRGAYEFKRVILIPKTPSDILIH